jgi:hypothetical protein
MNRNVRAERMFERAHGAEDCQEIFEFWWVENRFFSKNKSLGPTKGIFERFR